MRTMDFTRHYHVRVGWLGLALSVDAFEGAYSVSFDIYWAPPRG